MIVNPGVIDPNAYPGFKENPAMYITFTFVGMFMALGYLIVSIMLLQAYRMVIFFKLFVSRYIKE